MPNSNAPHLHVVVAGLCQIHTCAIPHLSGTLYIVCISSLHDCVCVKFSLCDAEVNLQQPQLE